MTTRICTLALMAPGLLLLGACSAAEDGTSARSQETSQSLAAMLADKEGLDKAAAAMRETGLIQVFDEAAYYTLLAPTDAAFAAQGEMTIESADQEAALAAVLRDHILPGYLTSEDIAQAIADSGDGSVEIQTMGQQKLAFSMDGDVVQVRTADGQVASLLAGEGQASNGVVIPVDAVLKQL